MSYLFKLLIFYSIFTLVIFALQRKIIYQPFGNYVPPKQVGLSNFKEINFTLSNNEQIKAWYAKANVKHKTIIYFHGNGGSLVDRALRYQKLYEQGFNVIALTYQGYPGSKGKASEKQIYSDSRDILKQIESDYHIKPKNIILYGESLGTGVAVELASKENFHAMILEAPYTNLADIAKLSYWFLPVDLLLLDRFDSLKKAQYIKTPTLIIHGNKDNIIPIRFGKELYASISAQKKFKEDKEAGHIDISADQIAKQVNQYIQSLNIESKL